MHGRSAALGGRTDELDPKMLLLFAAFKPMSPGMLVDPMAIICSAVSVFQKRAPESPIRLSILRVP